ncbi:MAG: hypothetical protein U1D30_06185 [Planctomycetota bacterium]
MLLSSLQSRLKRDQRAKAATQQVAKMIVQSATWELPPVLLRRRPLQILQRKILELQQAGYGEDEIQHGSICFVRTARRPPRTLRQQFVLQKIAEAEEIKIEEADLEAEIDELRDSSCRVAHRKGRSLGIHRAARLERKAVDILEYAKIMMFPSSRTAH